MRTQKSFIVLITFFIFTSIFIYPPFGRAEGIKEAAASLFVPTTGQAMNGQLGNTKTKFMGTLEFGLVATMAVIGTTVGGPAVWVAAGPLIANHVWSSADAFVSAHDNSREVAAQGVQDAQRNLDYSRDSRYEREQAYRSDIRQRVQSAGEQG